MNTSIQMTYINAMRKIIRDAYELKCNYIDEPSFDDGEMRTIPVEKFRSLTTQALMTTRSLKFVDSHHDGTIFFRLSNLRASRIGQDNQNDLIIEFIQYMDAIVSQVETGVLCFRSSELSAPAQGSLAQIETVSLQYLAPELSNSILKDIAELITAAQSKMYKTVALLAGSITETALLGVAKLNPEMANNLLKNKSKYQHKNVPDKCGIEELEYICRHEGILRNSQLSVENMSKYRDRIHPNNHTKQTELDDHSISIILGVLGQILSDLAISDKEGLMQIFQNKQI